MQVHSELRPGFYRAQEDEEGERYEPAFRVGAPDVFEARVDAGNTFYDVD